MNFNQIADKWDDILLTIKKEYDISDPSFNAWLKPLELYKLENNTLFIVYPEENDMSINIIKRKYEKFIKITIEEFTNEIFELEYIFPKDVTSSNSVNLNNSPANLSDNYLNSGLNPKYTFETFVVGSNNKFAQNAALAVAETPGNLYNPLYIYGGPGLGKTHLMHAIGNFIIKNNPDKKVIYVSSEDFTNEIIESLRISKNVTEKMSKFRDKYRNVDVLMIDDIQFINNKQATQEEFFHTFNSLHSAGKQIIITSDKSPKEMETLEFRLTSRFEMGLMADIGNPDYETRMAILRSKTEDENFDLDEEILIYIATNIKENIREIEGALNKLIAYSRLEKTSISIDDAKELLSNMISPDKPKEITPQRIIEVVADHYQISMDQMVSKNRTASIVRPRHIAMYLCRQLTDTDLTSIGKLLGNRDHTTVMHGAEKIGEECKNNEELLIQINSIKNKLNAN